MIFMHDIRAAGHCVRGIREWFEGYGLDFRAFMRDGITEAEFLATGDPIARQIVDLKHG